MEQDLQLFSFFIQIPVAQGDKGYGGFAVLDVDRVNLIKYPQVKQVRWQYANLTAGDCLFLPYSKCLNVHVIWTVRDNFNSEFWNISKIECMQLKGYVYQHQNFGSIIFYRNVFRKKKTKLPIPFVNTITARSIFFDAWN